jgi:hypothetical protein
MAPGAERREIVRQLGEEARVRAMMHVQDVLLAAGVAEPTPIPGSLEFLEPGGAVAPFGACDVPEVSLVPFCIVVHGS